MYKKIVIAGSILCSVSLLLSACGHDNPLLNEEFISRMKSMRFLQSDSMPIDECSKFYAGHGKVDDKKKCDDWTKSYYKQMLNGGVVATTTTLEDFRDPQFWKTIELK